jgi:hypothetical protein
MRRPSTRRLSVQTAGSATIVARRTSGFDAHAWLAQRATETIRASPAGPVKVTYARD